MDTIATRIIEVCVAKTDGNMSKFAREIGVTPAYISKLKNDPTRVPSDRTIDDICRVFRVREEWLRTGEGGMDIATTQFDKLNKFFADVLAMAPDERNAFVSALDSLPHEFWPLVAELARKYADNLKKED